MSTNETDDPIEAMFLLAEEYGGTAAKGASKLARAELARLRADLQACINDDSTYRVYQDEIDRLQQRIAELENDTICAFCGTHYHADDVPPEHWRTCQASPLVQRIAALEAEMNEARKIIIGPYEYHGLTSCACNFCRDRRAWLAAHPAVPPEQNAIARPANCNECLFYNKCKNTDGIDNAYGGLECTAILYAPHTEQFERTAPVDWRDHADRRL